MEGSLRFKMSKKWVWLDSKNSLKYQENSLKQLKTASTNSSMGLYSGGLIIGMTFASEIWRAYFQEGLLLLLLFIIIFFFFGGGGGRLLLGFYGI